MTEDTVQTRKAILFLPHPDFMFGVSITLDVALVLLETEFVFNGNVVKFMHVSTLQFFKFYNVLNSAFPSVDIGTFRGT